MAMPMFGVLGLIIIVLAIGVIAMLFGFGAKGLRRPRLGHATLNCPHCQAETRADLPTCQQCGQELSG